ncbi:MAG: Plug domain-containing protein [Prevotella sp.]|nr:Plug domain-containing protein [Prevotella sp.]
MKFRIVILALMFTMNISAQESADADTSIVYSKELKGVTVISHNVVRKMREAAMPVSVLGTRQLEGTTTSINDALARTAGITVRSTGGVGSASRISVRGLEGKRMGIYIDEAAIGQLSDYMTLNDVPTDMIERIFEFGYSHLPFLYSSSYSSLNTKHMAILWLSLPMYICLFLMSSMRICLLGYISSHWHIPSLSIAITALAYMEEISSNCLSSAL